GLIAGRTRPRNRAFWGLSFGALGIPLLARVMPLPLISQLIFPDRPPSPIDNDYHYRIEWRCASVFGRVSRKDLWRDCARRSFFPGAAARTAPSRFGTCGGAGTSTSSAS